MAKPMAYGIELLVCRFMLHKSAADPERTAERIRIMPKKETPRFQMANRVVIIAFILGALFVGLYQLAVKGIGIAWMGFVSVLFLLIPLLLRKIFRLRPAYLMDIVLYIFIFIAFDLGVALRLYGSIWWIDLAAHFVSGFLFTAVGLCIYYYLRRDKGMNMGQERALAVSFSFCFCQFTAVAWEIIEYAGFIFFGHDSQDMAHGVRDTMEDMIICMAGSIIMCILMAIHLRGKHKIFLFAPVDEFYRANFAPQRGSTASTKEKKK